MQMKSKIVFLLVNSIHQRIQIYPLGNLRHSPAKQPDNHKNIALGEGKHLQCNGSHLPFVFLLAVVLNHLADSDFHLADVVNQNQNL